MGTIVSTVLQSVLSHSYHFRILFRLKCTASSPTLRVSSLFFTSIKAAPVVAPLSGPTQLAGPNRIRDALRPLYYFIKDQKHAKALHFSWKILAEAISIWGKPINIYKFNAILLQNMHLTKNGMLCRLNHNIQNRIQI